MAPVAVAICPSNQDGNRSPHRPDYNEYGGQHWLGPLIAAHCRALGINAEVITASPESADSPRGSLSGLKAQQSQANAWLDQQPEPIKCIVNLHTDSGDFSHTFAIYGEQNPESRRLAEAIGPLVHQALSTESYRSFSRLGTVDYSTYIFATMARYPACLIEECAHTVKRDIDALYERPHEVAEAIARGIAAFAGIAKGEDWRARYEDLRARVDAAIAALS